MIEADACNLIGHQGWIVIRCSTLRGLQSLTFSAGYNCTCHSTILVPLVFLSVRLAQTAEQQREQKIETIEALMSSLLISIHPGPYTLLNLMVPGFDSTLS